MVSGLETLRQHHEVVVQQLTRQVEAPQAHHQRVVKYILVRRPPIHTIVQEVAIQVHTIEVPLTEVLALHQVHSTVVVLQTAAVHIQEAAMVAVLTLVRRRQVVVLQEVAVRRIVAHHLLRVVAILRHHIVAAAAAIVAVHQVRVLTLVEVVVAALQVVARRVVEAHQEAQDKL